MKVCLVPRCPNDAVKHGRCGAHERKAWRRPSQSSRVTANPRWRVARQKALTRARRRCEQCRTTKQLEVHHRQQVAHGGAPYALENLQVLCKQCHAAHHRAPKPLVVLVGLSGTGKTAIREQLAARLGVQSLAPDETGWPDIHDRLGAGGVVECCRMPNRLVQRLEGLDGKVVHITAPRALREERLLARGEPDEVATQRLNENPAITYDLDVDPDREVSSVTDPAQIAASLAAWVDLQRTVRQ